MQLTKNDWDRLSSRWLNDNVIEFLLKFWHYELLRDNPQLANQIHVFSPFLYQKLSDTQRTYGLESALRWDSKVNIFSKKFLIVPINEW
ncbi:hypothetical protein BDP27DRAFT_1244563 [Rhodocollybia butyracea]|uniref:Ubiquitin-like protease family profile domain-containing protein n=1 Tax=Rhodocollybia butyracea TaxID=206335 RepID=A0A9P5TWJ9_9AGAR|nr:hypothetical protein BDP27DRAFT_1244563 [Rhodocollybia butyracea]